jgi:hypothetical protein
MIDGVAFEDAWSSYGQQRVYVISKQDLLDFDDLV